MCLHSVPGQDAVLVASQGSFRAEIEFELVHNFVASVAYLHPTHGRAEKSLKRVSDLHLCC